MSNFLTRLIRRDKTEDPEIPESGTGNDIATSILGAASTAPTEPMNVSSFYRCVSLLTRTVASLPVEYQRRAADGTYTPQSDRLAWLLAREPEPGLSAFDFWALVIRHKIFTGNSYIWPMRDHRGDVQHMILLSPGSTHFDFARRVWKCDDTWRGIHRDFAEDELIHIKGDCPTPDAKEGVGVVEYMRRTLDTAGSGDRETEERFSNGGNVRGFLTNPPQSVQGFNKYADKELKKVAASKDLFFRSGGRITYIPGNVQFKELMLSSADMQFLESRKYTAEQICQFLDVPPIFAFAGGGENYKTAEMANMSFLQTLNPMLRQIENELERKLLKSVRERIRFDRSAIFACDLTTQVKWQQDRIASGLDTVNEARLSANRPPVEGGDEVLVSANLKSLKVLAAEQTAQNDRSDDTDQKK